MALASMPLSMSIVKTPRRDQFMVIPGRCILRRGEGGIVQRG